MTERYVVIPTLRGWRILDNNRGVFVTQACLDEQTTDEWCEEAKPARPRQHPCLTSA